MNHAAGQDLALFQRKQREEKKRSAIARPIKVWPAQRLAPWSTHLRAAELFVKKAERLAISDKAFPIAAVPSFPGDWLHVFLLCADHGDRSPSFSTGSLSAAT